MKTLTLLGNGKMALALAKGLHKEYKLEIIGRNPEKLKAFCGQIPGMISCTLMQDVDLSGKKVLLCVKPYALQNVADLCHGKAKWVASILAGVSLESIATSFEADAYIRTMPNVAASYQKSATTITGAPEIRDEILEIFKSIGTTVWVDTEKMLDIATALAGSGPAFLALAAESLIDGAIKEGLPRPQATELTQGLFAGFSELLQNESATLIKESVMSPGGTTAAGIAALEKNAARSAFIEAIHAAFEKAQSLK